MHSACAHVFPEHAHSQACTRFTQVLRDAHLRELHDRELQLQDMRQHIMFMDELELDELDPGQHEGAWRHSCLAHATRQAAPK